MIHELRRSLRSDTVFFGCTATLNVETEEVVKKNAGFRPEGDGPDRLAIIRISVDRPDISICIGEIPRGKLTTYESLYFVDGAVDKDSCDCNNESGNCTPWSIRKTIVFLDGRNQIKAAAHYLKQELCRMGYSTMQANQIIEVYTSHVAEHDKSRIYEEFSRPTSNIRIVIATTALGLGMNILDVELVVQHGFPISDEIDDLWQRIGRGVRGEGRKAVAVFLVPYWAIDKNGYYKAKPISKLAPVQKSKRRRNVLPQDRRTSRLREAQRISELSSEDDDCSSGGTIRSQTAGDSASHSKGLPAWTQQEMKLREAMKDCWKERLNSECYRDTPLIYLGEERCDISTQVPRPPPSECCNRSRCNPNLITLTPAPARDKPPKPPGANSRAGIALDKIGSWCRDKAEGLVPIESRFAPTPAPYFLSTQLQWKLASCFNSIDE